MDLEILITMQFVKIISINTNKESVIYGIITLFIVENMIYWNLTNLIIKFCIKNSK